MRLQFRYLAVIRYTQSNKCLATAFSLSCDITSEPANFQGLKSSILPAKLQITSGKKPMLKMEFNNTTLTFSGYLFWNQRHLTFLWLSILEPNKLLFVGPPYTKSSNYTKAKGLFNYIKNLPCFHLAKGFYENQK